MVDLSRKGQNVYLNALKTSACRKYGISRAPKLVEMIAALQESDREALLPKLWAKSVPTASGIAIIVMSKRHRCPHITTTENICVYCPSGPDSCWYMVQPMINVLDYSSKQEMRLELARQF
ncbi:hypothetical protein FF1_038754 [Malus domestica]